MPGSTAVYSQGRLLFSSVKKKELKVEFERVALPHLSHVYTAAFYLTKSEAQAEDLVQETYLRAFRFFHKFEPGTNCRAWLLSIQRRLFINRYRRKRAEPEMVDWERVDRGYESIAQQEQNTETGSPENLLFSHLLDQEIEEALKELPEEYRTAIILVDIEELTYEDAAKVLDCPVGTVRSRLSRGRRMLQVSLREYARKRGIIKEE